MRKAVLISIRPAWCEKILSGEKTIEVRKNRPKIETPFKCYIYCTRFYPGDPDSMISLKDRKSFFKPESGKVVGEFVCDAIYPISFYASDSSFFDDAPQLSVPGTCLTDREIAEYLGNGKTGCGWRISDLKIYDAPLSLDDFMKQPCDFAASCGACKHAEWGECHTFQGCALSVQSAPQSWCYVEELT